MRHQYVPGLELHPVFAFHGKFYLGTGEIKRDGLAVQKLELVWTVKQADIYTPGVRAVIVHYLIIRISYLRLADQILEDKTVLYLAYTQNRVKTSVSLGHRPYHSRHIMKFFLIFHLGPLVFPVREEFLVILGRVIIYVE